MGLGITAVRGTVGPLFIGHGSQKLFGSFGGNGLEGTGGFFESALGLRPGKRHATAAGVAELAGGALLTLGLLTPVATTLLTATMTTAIRKAHAANGPWVTDGGWEYNAVLIAAAFAATERGPGSLALDNSVAPKLRGFVPAVLAVAAGVAGSYLATMPPFNQAAPSEAEGGDADVAGDPAGNDEKTGA